MAYPFLLCRNNCVSHFHEMADRRQLAHHPHIVDRPHSAISNICSSYFQLSASSHTARISQSLTGNRCLTHLPHHAHRQHLHNAVSNKHNRLSTYADDVRRLLLSRIITSLGSTKKRNEQPTRKIQISTTSRNFTTR